MRGKHGSSKITIADSVARKRGTDHLDFVLREVGNLLIIASLLGVAEGNDTGNAVLLGLWEVLDGAVVDGRTLAAKEGGSVKFLVR